MLTINVNNLPAYAASYPFIVARACEGALWFFGAYDTAERAAEVAEMEDGLVLRWAE